MKEIKFEDWGNGYKYEGDVFSPDEFAELLAQALERIGYDASAVRDQFTRSA